MERGQQSLLGLFMGDQMTIFSSRQITLRSERYGKRSRNLAFALHQGTIR